MIFIMYCKVSAEMRTSSGQQMSSGSIILNREKLQSLKDIIPINAEEIQSEVSKNQGPN